MRRPVPAAPRRGGDAGAQAGHVVGLALGPRHRLARPVDRVALGRVRARVRARARVRVRVRARVRVRVRVRVGVRGRVSSPAASRARSTG